MLTIICVGVCVRVKCSNYLENKLITLILYPSCKQYKLYYSRHVTMRYVHYSLTEQQRQLNTLTTP